MARTVLELLKKGAPTEPRLASFRAVKSVLPASQVPTAAEIEDLFVFGKVLPEHLARDVANDVSEYHVRRSVIDEALGSIESGSRILLITGYPCDGKTLVVDELAQRLLGARPVYKLFMPYESLLNEVASILHYASNAVLIVENCFDLPIERLQSIARQFDGADGVLILTGREVAVDASSAGADALEKLDTFQRFASARLTEPEARVLSDLTDQIAGWRGSHAGNVESRLRFIMTTCEASLPHFLMRLLSSEYVSKRYREEFNRLSLNETERRAIILALYVTHIGENAPVSFLSEAMELDFGAIIDGLNRRTGNETFRLVRRNGQMIETVPSIGAQNILKNLFSDAEIVSSICPLLHNLAAIYRNPFEQHIFSQMMRFSILEKVVSDQAEIDRFFEHNKQHEKIRRMPLFWLQWHMAKCASGNLVDAEKLLEQGYREAREFEHATRKSFDKRQLDDRRAKFLMLRVTTTSREGVELFRDFKEAFELTEKVIRQEDPQRYPFETLKEIVRAYGECQHKLLEIHRPIVKQGIDNLGNYARRRFGMLPEGYQMGAAKAALQESGFPPDN